MNKALLLAGIAIVAVSKAIILKSILVDSPAYQKCVSEMSIGVVQTCGTDPFFYFMLGWFVTVGGAIMIIFGLRTPATKSISR